MTIEVRAEPGAERASLAGRTILVTGASKGVGSVTAAILGAAGAHVVAHYGSDRAGVEALPDGRRRVLAADFSDRRSVARLWEEAVAWRGRIDVLVNNAAIFLNAGGIEEDEAEWDAVWAKTLEVNVQAPAYLMRRA